MPTKIKRNKDAVSLYHEYVLKDDVYLEKFLKIKTKKGELIPFQINIAQKIVHEKICELRRAGKPVRLVILKARQLGISTLTEGLMFHDTANSFRRKTLIMTHEPDSTEAIFEMNKVFYDNLDPRIKPMRQYNNKKSLSFENPSDKDRPNNPGLGSQILVATASKKVAGRGLTIHNFHASEVAFWGKGASEIMLAILQAVSDDPNTMVVIESTANGIGGYFHSMYWRAKRRENDYTAIFLPWYIFPEYSRKVPADFTLTSEEVEFQAKHNLPLEKIAWRRWAILNKCEGSLSGFRQEYPTTDREAFIVTGSPVFNMDNLATFDEIKKPPLFRGDIVYSMLDVKSVKTPSRVVQEKGPFRIYEYPVPGRRYVIGGDTAKGTIYSDNSVLQVLDAYTGRQVATWIGKQSPTEFAYTAAAVGYYYNTALIGVEVNKDGITTNEVLHKKIKYPNLYKRKLLDTTSNKTQEKIGFHTNGVSRPLIINKLEDWINTGEFIINDEITIEECMTFVIGDDGKKEAQEGSHDDCVMALAIAIFLYETANIANQKSAKKLPVRTGPNW